MPELTDVVVAGGGILGTALAYELSRRSFRVLLLEAGGLGRGATGSSFAWVNATSKDESADYHRLNALAVAHLDGLAAQFGLETIGLHGGGSLAWAENAPGREQLRQRAARLAGWDYPVATLNADELRALEPRISFAPEAEGLFAPADRWLETARLQRFFIERVRERGGDLRLNCPVTGFTRDVTGRVALVETPQGRIGTSVIILAAGLQTGDLAALASGIEGDAARFSLAATPGLLLETPPGSAPGLANRVLYPPDANGLHLRPTPGGGLLLGADDTDGALSLPMNGGDLNAALADTLRREAARTLLERAARLLPALAPERFFDQITVRHAVRPTPADGLPLAGPLPHAKGVFLAATHSGVTLGPLLAQLLADEIATNRMPPLLASYRPDRLLT